MERRTTAEDQRATYFRLVGSLSACADCMGYLFRLPFGFSFTALRVSTVVLSLLSASPILRFFFTLGICRTAQGICGWGARIVSRDAVRRTVLHSLWCLKRCGLAIRAWITPFLTGRKFTGCVNLLTRAFERFTRSLGFEPPGLFRPELPPIRKQGEASYGLFVLLSLVV